MSVKIQNLTITLPVQLVNWLDSEAKEINISKIELIKNAILEFKKNIIKNKIKRSYSNSKEDSEMYLLAECGLNEFVKMV